MKRFWNDVKKYHNYEIRAAKTALKTEVANSYLNWIWWILNPLFEMLIYYFVFGYVFQSKEPAFMVFIFIGLTLWGFFNRVVVQSVTIIKKNKAIVSKVYLPKFVLLFTNMMVNGFKMMISWCIVVLMMIISRVHLSWNVFAAIPIMMVLVIITFGVSINLMHYGVFVEDLSNVIHIGFRLLFYMTGIFYNIENKLSGHQEVANIIMYCNPIAMLLRDMRNALIYQKGPNWIGLLVWGLIGILLSAVGISRIYKNENSYVKVI